MPGLLDYLSLLSFFLLFAIPLYLLYKFIKASTSTSSYTPSNTNDEDYTSTFLQPPPQPQSQPIAFTNLSKKKAKKLEEKARRREFNQWQEQQRRIHQEQADILWEHEQECRKQEHLEMQHEYQEIRKANEEQMVAARKQQQRISLRNAKICSQLGDLFNTANNRQEPYIVRIKYSEWIRKCGDIGNGDFDNLVKEVVAKGTTEGRLYLVQEELGTVVVFGECAVDYLHERIVNGGQPVSICELSEMLQVLK